MKKTENASPKLGAYFAPRGNWVPLPSGQETDRPTYYLGDQYYVLTDDEPSGP